MRRRTVTGDHITVTDVDDLNNPRTVTGVDNHRTVTGDHRTVTGVDGLNNLLTGLNNDLA